MLIHTPALHQLLLELLDPKIWAAGIRTMLEQLDEPPMEPVMVFSGERHIWR